MRYPAKKGAFIIYIIAFLVLVCPVSMFDKHFTKFTPAVNPAVVICLLVVSLFLWLWFDTYYVVKDGKLFYRSAFIRGSIPIDAIREVVKNKRGYSGIKASVAISGIVIKYNKWDDIFISPLNVDEFINKLKEINPGITVTE